MTRTSNNHNGLCVSVRDLAGMLSMSVRHIQRMDAAGKLPRSVRLGRSKRWVRSEIESWLRAGMPNRKAWESMRRAS